MKEKIKSTKAITLIALVVTIVILIILATVSMVLVWGDGGIISKTFGAKEQAEVASEKEQLHLAYLNVNTVKNEKDITTQDLKAEIEKGEIDAKSDFYGKWLLKVTFNQTNNSYTLSTLGEVEIFDSNIPPIYGKMSEVIVESLNEDNSNGLYYHNGLENGAEDSSYRYSGKNPNNYIKFNNETWRIIGVIPTQKVEEDGSITTKNLVKIINTNFTTTDTVKWDNNAGNTWSTSTLQKSLNSTQNGGYLYKLNTVSDYIANVNWKVSGVDVRKNQDLIDFYAKSFYDKEIKDATTTWKGKVGLMYVSDYAYAIAPEYWKRPLFFYDGTSSQTDATRDDKVHENNWMWATMGNKMEWTMTRNSAGMNNAIQAYRISDWGAIYPNNTDAVSAALKRLARAVVYLDEDISCTGGDGTLEKSYTVIK